MIQQWLVLLVTVGVFGFLLFVFWETFFRGGSLEEDVSEEEEDAL